MRALTVDPRQADSPDLAEIPDLQRSRGELLVAGLAVGVCGTDHEIIAGRHGAPPPGKQRMVLGHESLGRVIDAPRAGGFHPGDLVAGVVRRPDPVPCGACAAGHFDMCRNGRYGECGIKELDGFASLRWAVDPHYAVRLDPSLADVGVLAEPTSIVTKAWEQIDRVGARSWFRPRCVLVTGAGPIGLLAALLGTQRGLEVHVLDQVTEGPKPRLVADLGATYHTGMETVTEEIEPDIVIEATGADRLVADALTITGPYGIVCLTGLSTPGRTIRVDAAQVNREIVLENDVAIGSVSARQGHFAEAARVLAAADHGWLTRLISRRVPLGSYPDAFARQRHDVKVVIDLDSAAA